MERLTINAKQLLQAIKLHVICGAPIEILNYRQDHVGIRYSKANGYYMLAGDIYVTYEGGSTGKSIRDFRFLLRPLSSLTEEIEHNGERIRFSDVYLSKTQLEKLQNPSLCSWSSILNEFDYNFIQRLLKYHFDVFGLIDRGLALPIDGKEVEGDTK